MEKHLNLEPGFRLDYIELYNWGTFDSSVERLVPGCNTSLLTGANGSGKTTIVDALLTLLVPNTKRFYNQSSGAEQKKERDETSYVLGYYGKSIEEEGSEAKTQMLRKRTDCSVLLGCFFNAATGVYISLVQVRWFSNTELKRAYIVSPHKFTIKEHFNNIDTRGDWRKQLRKQYTKTEVNEAFSSYSEVFMHHFGMRSEKALSLFNLTVGIKVIGNLNEFIRVNMLEEGETEEEFQQLRENFQNLIETDRNIKKAEQQIEMLSPIVTKGETFNNVNTEINDIKELQNAVKVYYPKQEKELRSQALSGLKDKLKSLEDSKKVYEEELKLLRTRESSLTKSIEDNDAKKAIEKLTEQIEKLSGEKSKKQLQETEYNVFIKRLKLSPVTSEAQFVETKELIRQEMKQVTFTLATIDKDRINKYVEKESLVKECTSLEDDITSLRGRKSQIPRKNLEIRQSILDAVGAQEDEIPFIGELLKVRPEEKKWEAALESLLNNFGLCLLVPEKYIKSVNQYVNGAHLKGKVVYHKVNLSTSKDILPDIIENSVREKLEIKPDTVFEDWLEKRLAQQFDYICTENQEDFVHETRALMPSGLRKNADRHEKDGEKRFETVNYILGWDNREKIIVLSAQLQKKEKVLEELLLKINDFEQEKERLQGRESDLKDLRKFESYSELNWKVDEENMIHLEKQKKDLLEKANDLKELMIQLEELAKVVKDKDESRDAVVGKISLVGSEITSNDKRIGEIETFLNGLPNTERSDYYSILEKYIQHFEHHDPLTRLFKERDATENHLKEFLKQKEKDIKELEMSISKAMQKFIFPPKELTDRFPDWSGDTLNLVDNVQHLDDFSELYKRILEEDLPKHKQRFRSYMNDAILERITSFKTSLDLRLEEIEQHLKELNTSLKAIDFGKHPPTYIQLLSKATRDPEIREFFKPALQACMPNVADMALKEQDSWLEGQFIKIKNLIDKLHTDARLRKKVIDVRNWLEFSAEESFREDGTHHRYYDSSGSLSGGEKAQFTYTVLGAAIAYQFGINHDGSQTKSFRFITVDEAFSKLDPEKSNYLMELCKQLHLQLLVVTPLDKIHIAEPYISACHYVENKNRTRSHVFNLTMDQYRERKKEFEEISEAE